ncbi:hypothetical protein BK672_08050 [Pseudomonas fluorescens]|uniref:Uncharacterized protein n=1 Tax=Pseudomonas fluorescens TaxID=294 RepID=A0A423NE54_PSEFL|nr:hypothetical protein BK672_08050 [Pseudomonas fluorescens]
MTGRKLQRAFARESRGARGEIQLFRAFIRAFNSLGPDALAQEYHGSRYQVKFREGRGAGRPIPRCELCDVLIVHYQADNPSAARMTFNQAKVTTNPIGCRTPSKVPGQSNFMANMEQWDLLSNCPSIHPATKTFHPPVDLLSSAILPSVGTFGVFYPVRDRFDFAYFIASELSPLAVSPNRQGTLQWKHAMNASRIIAGYEEVTGTCCLQAFGSALEKGLIGTPIQPLLYGTAESIPMRGWLTKVLTSLRIAHPNSDLPRELLMGLELGGNAEGQIPMRYAGDAAPPRAVILVRTKGADYPL